MTMFLLGLLSGITGTIIVLTIYAVRTNRKTQ